jgi:hypothetical protein
VFTYGEAETALARVYAAEGGPQQGAFRGRLKALKKLGIPLGSHPGRGRKIEYGYDELYQWMLCLELAELGVDPAVVGKLMRDRWELDLRLYFYQAEKGLDLLSDAPDDVYVMIHTELMSASWRRRKGGFNESFPGLLEITPFDLTIDGAKQSLTRLTGDARRAYILNISDTVRLLAQAIRELGMGDRLPDHLNYDVAVERALARATPPRSARA